MLRYQADRRSIAYLITATALLFVQWNLPTFNPFLFVFSLFMGVGVAVIAHNHNHVPMWRERTMNILTDYWITLFYGFPAFAWIPTHNRNHHHYNNREGDYTITYRVSERNNILTFLSYPSISSYFQQQPIYQHLARLWQKNRQGFYIAISQYGILGVMYIVALLIDWKKALLYIALPHQFALFSILIFNYVQHVHADEESEYNHSRNFVGPMLNTLLFNNGFHTIHHLRASIHWSETPQAHEKIKHLIEPHLMEPSFWGYIFRAYIVSMIMPSKGTDSMRLARLHIQHKSSVHS